MRTRVVLFLTSLLLPAAVAAQKPPLLPEKDVAALAQELSGETAKRNLEGMVRNHRQRGSRGFHAAAELVAERARAYGLSDVAILQFPADGKIFYGTQRSRPAWDVESAELWEMRKNGNEWTPDILVASYDAMPITLAEDSESAEVTADLLDVGEGTKESDYAGKDVKGKIVLASAQPGAVQDLAVGKFGAAGIISYAQNQKTAWWGEDDNLIRWGHLQSFSKNKTFGFMVSLKTARAFRERLSHGEQIHLHATVKAGQHPGNYEIVTATIPGADAKLKNEEIAFSCHLDHQRPGANDNASGCVTILEVARTLQKLINEGKLARPARTIRFIWPPEIEGTMAILNAKPESYLITYPTGASPGELEKLNPRYDPVLVGEGAPLSQRLKAVVHMDMVGGGPVTKAVFHVTRGPMSLPSFVHDVAWAFAEFVNEQSYKFVATGSAEYPLVAPEGGKEPLRAEFSPYSMGSDHDVYQDSSFKIPAIYLNDWPDRYIHTNFDSAANIDTTKLKRAAFIGAASGYFLAQLNGSQVAPVIHLIEIGRFLRAAETYRQSMALGEDEAANTQRKYFETEAEIPYAMKQFLKPSITDGERNFESILPLQILKQRLSPEKPAIGPGLVVFLRSSAPKGALAVLGYDYLADHAQQAGISMPKLVEYQGLWGAGEEYAYETLNFVDGKRNAQQIRDAVSAEYGPVPLELVVEYLKVLEKIGVLVAAK